MAEFILLLGSVVLLSLLVLGLILFVLWKIPKVGKFISVAVGGCVAFIVITAIWPPDSFYINEIQNYTNLELKDRAKVLAKRASYPDFHGDYSSEALFKVTGFSETEIPEEYVQTSCGVHKFVRRHVENIQGAASCWSIQIDIDQTMYLMYLKDMDLLHYLYIQT